MDNQDGQDGLIDHKPKPVASKHATFADTDKYIDAPSIQDSDDETKALEVRFIDFINALVCLPPSRK